MPFTCLSSSAAFNGNNIKLGLSADCCLSTEMCKAKTTSLGAPKLCLSVVVPNSSSKIAKVSSSSSSSPSFSLNLEDTRGIFWRNEYLFVGIEPSKLELNEC
uniref:Uncharacterized protein n=1 Tax=Meloidogyne enterolobii TaxID=390850 RepID=A0A6V7X697_MELEN|nr:unnamed protein product [Meloidogyne enterolobii]